MSGFASQTLNFGNFPGDIRNRMRSPLQGTMSGFASRTLNVGNFPGDIRKRMRSPLQGTMGSSAIRTLYVGYLLGDIRERIRGSPSHGCLRLAASGREGDLPDNGSEAEENGKGACKKFDFDEKDLSSDDSLWDLYERWISHYSISRDLNEKQKRFNVFKENAKYIHNFNKEGNSYKLGLNMFGDMSEDEFSSIYYQMPSVDCEMKLLGNTDNKGYNGGLVKDGTCDAFKENSLIGVFDGLENAPTNNENAC